MAQFEADFTLKFTYVYLRFYRMTQKSTTHRFNYKSNFVS